MAEILGIIERVISLGQQIADRIGAYNEAKASLKRLENILELLKEVVVTITKSNVGTAKIVIIRDTLVDAQKVYVKYVEKLDAKENIHRKNLATVKKFVGIYKAPSILIEIENTIVNVERYLNITKSSMTELREALTNTIDQLVTRLTKECQELQEKLDCCTLSIEPFFAGLGSDNPEALSFWKDRFRSAELSISSIAPYESMYVSWARFVHELEVNFPLKNIPTATNEAYLGDIDAIRQHGNRYYIDQTRTRNLKDIRPLWLPALRKALDPLHRGYIKPHDYFSFLGGESLSKKLRQVVLDSCGYGIFVECQRTSSDIALPSEIESPAHAVGWMSVCQIISVPSPAELGIFIYDKDDEVIKPNLANLVKNFTYPKNDIWVYVRYLQTGQIEKKLLSENVRMLGGLRIGISIAICYALENGSCTWSDSLSIVELEACAGGRYIVTAGSKENTNVFVTKPPIGFGQPDDSEETILPEFDYCLLGPSTIFAQEPKVGEKIQIKAEEYWYDYKVTAVNGENVEYVDWYSTSDTNDNILTEDDEDDSIGFSYQFEDLKKGNSKSWCPWTRGVSNSDIRPYRCLHVGDLVEAPVVYPDYRFHYYGLEESQLYLPARIIDVQGDQYLVKFSPAVIAYKWWPGPNDKEFPREPNANETVKNPFVGVQVMVSMDRVRPYVGAGPHPVLGTQSIRPQSYSAFQGAQFTDQQRIDENILWKQ
ncbi:9749_t:CDS:2 [Ambispora gerdemannii]|uniref:9749_t:CDS:1 n=1 Tax=Ambispora gerdemannii TaxID=144530 RepID=A0A9N9CIT0_9GLOM|nr:9749_t:CDS:2 [Ambispora gerdemannii]